MFKLEISSSNIFEVARELEKYLVVEPRNLIALQVVFSAHEIDNVFDDWFTKKKCVCKTRPTLFVDEKGVLHLDDYELYPAGDHGYPKKCKDFIMLFSPDYAYEILPLKTTKKYPYGNTSVEVITFPIVHGKYNVLSNN
jgi:hypothetical protein